MSFSTWSAFVCMREMSTASSFVEDLREGTAKQMGGRSKAHPFTAQDLLQAWFFSPFPHWVSQEGV